MVGSTIDGSIKPSREAIVESPSVGSLSSWCPCLLMSSSTAARAEVGRVGSLRLRGTIVSSVNPSGICMFIGPEVVSGRLSVRGVLTQAPVTTGVCVCSPVSAARAPCCDCSRGAGSGSGAICGAVCSLTGTGVSSTVLCAVVSGFFAGGSSNLFGRSSSWACFIEVGLGELLETLASLFNKAIESVRLWFCGLWVLRGTLACIA